MENSDAPCPVPADDPQMVPVSTEDRETTSPPVPTQDPQTAKVSEGDAETAPVPIADPLIGSEAVGASEQRSNKIPMRVQQILIMRHGDRIDAEDPNWGETAERTWDPPLTDTGLQRARATGRRLRRQGFNITRVVVSPFLRCIQTACEVITALCALDTHQEEKSPNTSEVPIDPSRVKVSIEYGLCEIMNSLTIRAPPMLPGAANSLDLMDREGLLPAGTVDPTVKKIMTEQPRWQESLETAYWRYAKTFEAVADMFPTEDVLCVTHGEGVGVSVSHFRLVTVYEVKYCAVSHLQRPIYTVDSPPEAGKMELLTESGEESGIGYSPR